VNDLCVWRDRGQQQSPVASAGIALVAEDSARLLTGKVEHLRAFRDRLGKLELTRINPNEIVVPPARAAARPSAGVPSARRWT
jgi:hypothetical protein